MLKCVKLLQNASFDEISKTINDALKLGSSTDFGYDYLVDFEKRFQLKARNPITTGWSELDTVSKGGLGSGELGVVIAPTGAGKSMAMQNLATNFSRRGMNGIYITLELSEELVCSRIDSINLGRSKGLIKSDIKGAAADPKYALERAIMTVCAARGSK